MIGNATRVVIDNIISSIILRHLALSLLYLKKSATVQVVSAAWFWDGRDILYLPSMPRPKSH